MLYTKTGRFFTELLKNKKGIVLHVHCIETLLRTVVIVHPAAGLLSGGRRCGGFFDMPGDGFGGCTTQHSFFYWINAHSVTQKTSTTRRNLSPYSWLCILKPPAPRDLHHFPSHVTVYLLYFAIYQVSGNEFSNLVVMVVKCRLNRPQFNTKFVSPERIHCSK